MPAVSCWPSCSSLRRNLQCTGCGSGFTAEKRHALPSLPEFLPILEELGIRPEVTELPELPPGGFGSGHDAKENIARRLYVTPGTEAMSKLARVMENSLQEVDGAWYIEGAQPLRPCIVAWEPAGQPVS